MGVAIVTGDATSTRDVRDVARVQADPFARLVGVLATVLACIMSVYVVLTCILAVHRFYFAAPYGDVWWFIKDIADFRSHIISINFLWRQHSEHRIVLPRLILWIDLQCFQFRGVFSIFCSFLFQAGEVLLLCSAFWRVGNNNTTSKFAYVALVLSMMFSSSQIENFVVPFNVQFPLSFFMASLSIFLILRHCESSGGNWTALIFGLVAASCATLSLGSGLLVWPVLLFVCLFERASLRTVGTVTIAGAAMWVFYFVGYLSPPERANPWDSLAHPVDVGAFTFTFLASAISSTPSRFAGILGLVSFSFLAICIVPYARAQSDGRWRSCAFFSYLALFIMGAALLTALGRINYGLIEAEAIRYRTPTLIFWASILGLGVCWWNDVAGDVGRSVGAPVLAVLFLAIFVVPAQRAPVEHFARLSRQINDNSIALAFDSSDKAYDHLFFLRPDLVRQYTPFLRINHLSVFADPLFTARGEQVTTLFAATSAQGCSGAFEGVKQSEGTKKESGTVFGWGWLGNESHGPATVVLADDRGAVVGLAHGNAPRPDVARYFGNPNMLDTGWSGYFHAEPDSMIITAYAVLSDGMTLCQMGQGIRMGGST